MTTSKKAKVPNMPRALRKSMTMSVKNKTVILSWPNREVKITHLNHLVAIWAVARGIRFCRTFLQLQACPCVF